MCKCNYCISDFERNIVILKYLNTLFGFKRINIVAKKMTLSPPPFFFNVFAAAVNFLKILLEPDPAKRPNIQQALANRWLSENGKALNNVTYPNR